MKGLNDNARKVVEFARELGFRVSKTKNNHLRFDRPGQPPVFFSWSPSDHRAIKNGYAKLRRASQVSLAGAV